MNAVAEKSLGSTTYLKNDIIQPTLVMNNAGANLQVNAYIALAPFRDGTNSYLDDLNFLAQNDSRIGLSTKILVQSMILDVTFRWSSTFTVGVSQNGPISGEIDVYEVSWNRMLQGEATTYENIWSNANSDTPVIPGMSNSLTITSRGATPFDFPACIS